MIQFGIRQVRAAFFDQAAVRTALDAGTRKALSKFGAFVRQRARSSIRTRKKSSPPGQPPSSHEGSLKRLIFFAYDASAKTVVIGPVPFRAGEAPSLLEHGGTAVKKSGRPRRYRGNPFVLPAARAELPKFPDLLRDMVN